MSASAYKRISLLNVRRIDHRAVIFVFFLPLFLLFFAQAPYTGTIQNRWPGYLDIIGGQACRRVRGRPTISVSILLLAGATDMYASVHHHTPPSTFNCGSAETMRVLAICSFVPSRQIGSGSARCRRGFAEIGRPESELSIMAELSAITLLHSSAARR